MIKKFFTFFLVPAVMLSACNSTPKSENSENVTAEAIDTPENDVPFTEAKNYFVKNTYEDGGQPDIIITSQADFDNIFGTAATMNENSMPTPIDFSKQYVIAHIEESSEMATTLEVESLETQANELVLTYSQTDGEKQSFSTRPFLLLIVDNEYQGELRVVKE